jgi:hypothetical protein
MRLNLFSKSCCWAFYLLVAQPLCGVPAFLKLRFSRCRIVNHTTTRNRVNLNSIIFLIVFLGAILLSAFARANDTFPGQTLTGNSGSFVDNNSLTTGETGEPTTLPAGSTLNTQWYSWTSPVSGFVSFGTCNPTGSSLTTFDTTIGVYTGAAVGSLTQIGFNDDTPGCNSTVNANYGSTVAFTATAGTTYRIQVDGYGPAVGQFNLFYGYSGYTTAVVGPTTTEGGGTGSFTVVLTAVPTGAATITIGTSPQCTFAPSTLNFSSANWNVAQTVTVTAINDTVLEGAHFCSPTSITPSGGGVVASSAPPPTFSVVDNDTATVSIANTTNGAEAGPTNGVMTVTLSAVSPINTVVSYTVTGTATSGTDYTALPGSITIPAGSTTATISIPITNDLIVETAETVIVTLNAVTTGVATTIGAPAAATNTITDNDTATVSIANTTNGSETGPTNGVMTVTQSSVSATNTVVAYTRTGTATSGSDFTALSGTVTIPAGSTTATITIPVINDAAVEGNETVILTLSSVTSGLATLGAPLVATNTIADNDAPIVTIANTTNGTEAGPVNGVMTVTQTAVAATPIIISYTITGTATSGADFTALSGTVTIPTGATTAIIAIPVIDDLIVEGSETVIVTLTAVTSGAASLGATLVATNTIADNDTATVTIANTTNGTEAGPASGVMTITQTNASSTDTVLAYTVSGTATSGADFTALSGTVTILAGATTATITIPVIDDALVEGPETVIVTLTSITSGQATLGATLIATNTNADNDSATVTIANTTNGAEAGPVAGVMTVTQTAVSATNTIIAYSISGTATSGSDFTALSGTVAILAGATTAIITIPVLDDAVLDPAETVIVTLTSISSGLATLGAPLVATNTIADNEAATVVIANTTNGAEAGPVNGVMTVTQSLASPTNTLIAYTVSGTATSGTDYTALSGTVTILAGATTATIIIPVTNDAIVETAETVIVTLTGVTFGYPTLGATLIATNTIADNDSATVTIANTSNGAEAGPTAGVMTVTQTAVSATNTVIAYTVSGTATSGADYSALSGTVTILAGATTATITIPIINDLVVDPTETVTITLTAISSGLASLGATLVATNTITDNDVASFTISKAVNLASIAAPGPLNYTITVANTGNIPLTAPVITDALSDGAALTLSSGPTLSSGDAAPLGVLNVGETWIYTATYVVTQAKINSGVSITNAATFDTAETAPATSNTVTTTITQTPLLTIAKSPSTPGPVPVSTVITYTYVITNAGNLTMTNVAVNDTHNGSGILVGPGNEVLADNAPLGDSSDAGINGTWDTLGPGDVVTFTATYAVTQNDVDYLQ